MLLPSVQLHHMALHTDAKSPSNAQKALFDRRYYESR